MLEQEGGGPGRDGRHDCAPGGPKDPGDKVNRQEVEVGGGTRPNLCHRVVHGLREKKGRDGSSARLSHDV